MIARIRRLARVLCMTAGPRLGLEKGVDGRWWLVGCVEGDQPLPQTRGAATVSDALDRIEAWLAPEIDGVGVGQSPTKRHPEIK